MLRPLIDGSISTHAHRHQSENSGWRTPRLITLKQEKRYPEKLLEITRQVHEANTLFEYDEIKLDLSASGKQQALISSTCTLLLLGR